MSWPSSTRLDAGWSVAPAAPGEPPADADWLPALVPGTAAGALRAAGRWQHGDPRDLDEEDWWFRCSFAAAPPAPGEQVVLVLEGVATRFVVLLDGEVVLEGASMWERHEVDVGARLAAGADHVLEVRCTALGPVVRTSRRPRARWRTKVAAHGLRFERTALLGRMPGIAPGPAAVGPWRPVRLERRAGARCAQARVLPRLQGDHGVLDVELTLEAGGGPEPLPAAVEVVLDGPSGRHAVQLPVDQDGLVRGELRVAGIARWWPHTHGEPVLHDVVVRAGAVELLTRRVGFRTLAGGPGPTHDVARDGLALHVNGVAIFARGAVWTPVDPVGLAPGREALRARLQRVRDAGLDLVRLAGIGLYEEEAFHALCDELGILVWQDLMFANFDYPVGEDEWRATVEREAASVLGALAGRPSLAVVCGGSEVEQQATMLGLDPALATSALTREVVPAALAASGADAIWLTSAPTGGALPFRASAGVANWFGVGGYRRGIDDARRAEVRFASECLAFANVPDEDVLAAAGVDAGVPRDAGSPWDFRDVVDHYVATTYGLDCAVLRATDPPRWLELSRAITGHLMAEVLGEWRRAASPCAGAVVLWLADLEPGSGWGLLDHRGCPKVAWHHVARASDPVAVWTTDEGLGGIAVHVANDRPEPLAGTVRVALHQGEQLVAEGAQALTVAGRTTVALDAEAVLGHFHDISHAYRFGPPSHDVVVVTLEAPDGTLRRQALRFPLGLPIDPRPADELGAVLEVEPLAGGALLVRVRTRRALHGCRAHAPGFEAADGGFDVAPGGLREVVLTPVDATSARGDVALSALNLDGRLAAAAPRQPAG